MIANPPRIDHSNLGFDFTPGLTERIPGKRFPGRAPIVVEAA